jgi:hypothetical protein
MIMQRVAAGTVSIATTAQLATNGATLGGNIAGVSVSHLTTSDVNANTAGEVQIVSDLVNTLWDVELSSATTGQTLIGDAVAFAQNNVVQSTLAQSRGYAILGTDATPTALIVDFVRSDDNDIVGADSTDRRITVRFNNNIGQIGV